MNDKELLARDVITGQRGRAVATVDGEVRILFELKKVEATVTFEKQDIRTVGNLGTQSKVVGYKGAGTMTKYYVSSWDRKLAITYMKTGVVAFFTLLVENDDKSSSVGKQTTVLYDCSFDSTVLAKMDVDNQALEEDSPFTFGKAEILNEFVEPVF